ncbi:hypothetical protein BJV78DRAFT_1189624 [Lactifluus subvellereus]|nr:hypothetical protein BJV78DRAFT_1189624 [Lactifluus subvellereus]
MRVDHIASMGRHCTPVQFICTVSPISLFFLVAIFHHCGRGALDLQFAVACNDLGWHTPLPHFTLALALLTSTGAWTGVLLFNDNVEGTVDKIMSSVVVFALACRLDQA